MKYAINSFTKGTVDPEIQSKLDQDYKHKASYCKNFYRDKGDYIRRRPPLRLYRDSRFSQTELDSCLDYKKIGDVEYIIQGPTSARDATLLPLLLTYTGAATYGTPADRQYGTTRSGTFTSGTIETTYDIDYRVIRIAGEVKTEHTIAIVALTQGARTQKVAFYMHDLATSIENINHRRLNSFEFVRIGNTGTIILSETASRLKTALEQNTDISVRFDSLPNKLQEIKNTVKLNVFDSRVTLKASGDWTSERYYSALSSDKFRVTDNHQFASKLQAREVDFDNLKIAIVPVISNDNPDPVVYDFTEALTGSIAGTIGQIATRVARGIEDQLKDVVTVLPSNTNTIQVLPDVKFQSEHSEGNGVFRTVNRGATGSGVSYQIYSIPEAGIGRFNGWRAYPLGTELSIYNRIVERFTANTYSTEQEWEDAKDAWKEARRTSCSESARGGAEIDSCQEWYIVQEADRRFGATYLANAVDDLSEEELAFYNKYIRNIENLEELGNLDGSYILGPEVNNSFLKGLALSTANWFGALCIYAPGSFNLEEIITTKEIDSADRKGISEFAPNGADGQVLGDASYACLIYYNADKMNQWGEDNYLFQGVISTEVGLAKPFRLDQHTLQKLDSAPITDDDLLAEVSLSLHRPANDSGDRVFRGKWLNVAGRDDNFSTGLHYEYLYGNNLPDRFNDLEIRPQWARNSEALDNLRLGISFNTVFELNPVANELNETPNKRTIRWDDDTLYLSAADAEGFTERPNSFISIADAKNDSAPTSDSARTARKLPPKAPSTGFLAQDIGVQEGINALTVREGNVFITTPQRVLIAPKSALFPTNNIFIDEFAERGLDGRLNYESTVYYGSQDNQVISFRFYEEAQGYLGRNETSERTIETVTQMDSFIQRHNLLMVCCGGTNKMYVLSLEKDRNNAGLYDLEFDSTIRRFYKLDHDRLLIIFESGVPRVLDLSLDAVDYRDERLVGSETQLNSYESWIKGLPIVIVQSGEGFRHISQAKITQATVGIGGSYGAFDLTIESEGRLISKSVRVTNQDPTNVLQTSLPVIIEFIRGHSLKAPIIGIRTNSNVNLKFTTIIAEIEDKN